MNFLQAHAAVKAFAGGAPLRFTLVSSAVTATLDLYLRAHAAQAGFEACVETIPFNSLAQRIRTPNAGKELEVFLLAPWDFLPQADWRTGVPDRSPDQDQVRTVVAEHAALFARRQPAKFVYLPAPMPPIMSTLAATRALEAQIAAAALSLGAVALSAAGFNLSSYFETGNPFSSQALSEIAQNVIGAALNKRQEPKKVLVTDLDNTLWSGVIGEDGLDGIAHAPEGRGFRFFAYQTLLKKLRNEGVILAAVSRNDKDLALAPFARGDMVLQEGDFVAIIASYHSKSAQIQRLATDLNLGLDAFVFVDDNPIELEEVRTALPQVECVRMQHDAASLPALLDQLTGFFGRSSISEEDTKRTEMYRARARSSVPSDAQGADLHSFLESLQMTLTIRERKLGDHARCLQLINKTNQFNINGRRFTEAELQAVLEEGGHLIGAALEDRNGSHGEVIACLVDARGTLQAFVMSCRVFQRRAEHAFVAWLAGRPYAPRHIQYLATQRNEPSRMFLRETCGNVADGAMSFDAAKLRSQLAADLALFRIREE